MTKHIPVEGRSGFYRDSESTAIINKDKKAYVAYMERKKSVESKNNELNQMKKTINYCKKMNFDGVVFGLSLIHI